MAIPTGAAISSQWSRRGLSIRWNGVCLLWRRTEQRSMWDRHGWCHGLQRCIRRIATEEPWHRHDGRLHPRLKDFWVGEFAVCCISMSQESVLWFQVRYFFLQVIFFAVLIALDVRFAFLPLFVLFGDALFQKLVHNLDNLLPELRAIFDSLVTLCECR